MVYLRCSKCGSDAGFLIETAAGQRLDVKGKLPAERIQKSVLVTCTYCNNRWDQIPVSLIDNSIDEKLQEGAQLTH